MSGIDGLIYFNYAALSFGAVVILNQISRLIPHLKLFLSCGFWGLLIIAGVAIIVTKKIEILLPVIIFSFLVGMGILLSWLP